MPLIGTHACLDPLHPDHADELWPAVDDDEIRRFWPRPWNSQDDVRAQFRSLCAQAHDGTAEPYLIRTVDGIATGSTSLYDMDPVHRQGTIGWTFIAHPHRRTPINTESKLLLLTRAFEDLAMERVQFHVDRRNERSRSAVQRLGAMQEGVLRRHKVLWDGFVRDTVVFSILRDEWPEKKRHLESLLH